MGNWFDTFKYNPLPPLLNSSNEALRFFAKRDLLGEEAGSIEALWELSSAKKILRKQQENGSWRYPKKENAFRRENYFLFETYKQLALLVFIYGFNKKHEAIQAAAEYIFSCQTDEGDIRGIYGNQYMPNYSSAIIELLIMAGYENDPRVEKHFRWILALRQNDGAWAWALYTQNVNYMDALDMPPLKPDPVKPFSHILTGVILRPFAVHSKYRNSPEARTAGRLLLSRLFKADKYGSRKSPDYWTKFTYPFWYNDLLNALNTFSLLGFKNDTPQIKKGLDWFISRQQSTGLWKVYVLMGGKHKDLNAWLSLAICRVFKRFYEQEE
jgi:hypothetical protein